MVTTGESESLGATQTSASTPFDAILSVQGVVKSFGGLQVLRGIDLEVEPGTIHGLIGPNGCGKSTLFDVVTGNQKSNEGKVVFRGTEIGGVRPDIISRRGLVRTFQLTRVFRSLTVAENLLVFAGAHRADGKKGSEQRVIDLLEFVHLSGLAEREASTLSYGQSKLLELAQVLMHQPTMLLLDEPFAGINPGLIDVIVGHLQKLRDQGMTVLLVEHNLPMVSKLCDRIAVINSGKVIINDLPDVVVNDPRVREAFLGD